MIFVTEDDGSRPLRCHMAGVKLHRGDVLRLIGATPRAGIGGRPRKTKAWTDFWHAIVTIAARGELNRDTYPTQKKLRADVLLMINEVLSEDSIKGEISAIWEKHVKAMD